MEASERPQGRPLTAEEADNFNSQTRIIIPWVFWVGLLAFTQIFILDISIFKDVAFIVVSVLACVFFW